MARLDYHPWDSTLLEVYDLGAEPPELLGHADTLRSARALARACGARSVLVCRQDGGHVATWGELPAGLALVAGPREGVATGA